MSHGDDMVLADKDTGLAIGDPVVLEICGLGDDE